MKAFAGRIYGNPKYAKALQWGKLITITGFAQALIQLAGLISGILIIRLLSIQEYALYTLANTMLGTMTMLADSGISNGVMAQGGKVWENKRKLGVVLATGLKLRRRFGIISLLVTLPVLGYLILTHGGSWLSTLLIVVSIIPAFFAALSDSFLEMAPRLHQDIKPLQRNAIEVSIARLTLNGLLLFFFPFTFIAIIANGIPRLYGNYQLKKISAPYANDLEESDPIVEKEVIVSVKRTLPIVIYHCIAGQISIWLISFFGTTSDISELGALGRIYMLFNLCSILFATLIIPRFSRMKASKDGLLRTFILVQAGAILISIAIIITIWLFSSQLLWALGKNYFGLDYELLLMGIVGSIGLLNTVCSQLVIARGWYINPYFLIGINFSSTVISAAFFNISTITGILYFNIIVYFIAYLLSLSYGIIMLKKATANLT